MRRPSAGQTACRVRHAIFGRPYGALSWCVVLAHALLALHCLTAGTALGASPLSFNAAPLRAHAMQLLADGRLFECADTWNTIHAFATRPADKAEALVRMGDVYAMFLDLPEQALAVYGNAMRLYPGRPELENAYFNAGMLRYEAGQPRMALAGFQAYLALFPSGSRRDTAEYMRDRLSGELASGHAVPPADSRPPQSPLGNEPMVRVSVAEVGSFSFSLSGTVSIPGYGRLETGNHVCTVAGTSLVLDGRACGGQLTISLADGQRMQIGAMTLAGDLLLRCNEGKVLVVNRLGMETYLQGVVPGEMSPSFSMAALQAQAVAARSYALYLLRKSEGRLYDVTATTASQVYGGAGVGNARTRAAVARTRGRVLTYGGRVVLAYFHAHSGGMLEDDSRVWTSDMPYYQVRDDRVSNAVHAMRWQWAVSGDTIAGALRRNGFDVASIRDVRQGDLSESGRLATVVVETPERSIVLKANTFRLMLGPTRLKSTLCRVTRQGGEFVFSGAGYGHGVGMSQWGAEGMGRAGAGIEAILAQYYPGTSLMTLY